MQGQEVEIAGEAMIATCSRALFWPARRIAFVADIHLGKAAAFRARQIPLPHGTTDAAFERLNNLLQELQPDRLIVLGDLWHDRQGKTAAHLQKLTEWTKSHPRVKFTLVTGNHDQKAGETPCSTGFECVDELELGPFRCLHHPVPREGKYVLCGHVHPGIDLGSARTTLKLPCFYFSKELAILPAFGEFTGLAAITLSNDDEFVCVVTDEKIFTLGGKGLVARAVQNCAS